MKKLLSAAALSLIAAVIFVSCAKSPEMTVDVIKTKDGTSLTVRSGTEQRSFSVEEGRSCEVFVTVKKAGGTLDLKIESADGEKTLYVGKDLPSSSFSVTASEAGDYVIFIEAFGFIGGYTVEWTYGAA